MNKETTPTHLDESSVLKEGENCWKISNAKKLAVLVHGKNYFKTAFYSIQKAQHHVMLLAWDINSQIPLLRGEDAQNIKEVRLGPFLNNQTKSNKNLHIYILNWEYSQLLAHTRELFPRIKFKLNTTSQVHFFMDEHSQKGACHHQKILTIDDSLAFCGGIDFTHGRWDTKEHAPHNQLRVNKNGVPQRPVHDMAMMVSGDTAFQLGVLCRERMDVAKISTIPKEQNNQNDNWPEGITPLLEDVTVGISRTWLHSNQKIKESLKLTIDLIQSTKDILYIENQYLTSDDTRDALISLLQRPKPPHIIIVLTPYSDGWVEQRTMDILKSTLIDALKNADHKKRLHIYHPYHPGLKNESIHVHAKMMIIDNRYLRVGSTNLSNRSMHLDTECDLVADVGSSIEKQNILNDFRLERVGEHYGLEVVDMKEQLTQGYSLVDFIENNVSLDKRCLYPIDHILVAPNSPDFTNPDIYDPHEPVDYAKLSDILIGAKKSDRPVHNFLWKVAALGFALSLIALWKWSPLEEWIQLDHLIQYFNNSNVTFTSSIIIILSMALLQLLMVPLTVVVVAALIAYGSMYGLTFSFISAFIASILGFGIGNYLGTRKLRDIAGEKADRISKALGKQGILSSIAMRLLPIAPFTIINLVAGASHIRFKDYMIGASIGQLPGMIALMIIVNRMKISINDPQASIILASVSAIVGVVVLLYLLARYVKKRIKEKAKNT